MSRKTGINSIVFSIKGKKKNWRLHSFHRTEPTYKNSNIKKNKLLKKQTNKKKNNVVMTPLIALVILLLDSICASGNGERLKISKDTLVQQNTAYLLTTGLARSTWRLAAEDGNVHTYTHTLPLVEYTTGEITCLLFLSDTQLSACL